MSEHTPTQAGVEPNGNGGDPGVQMDGAMAQRLRAVTREFSHRELAELTGLSHETARRYLEGRVPSPVFIKRLCESLGISADWLLLGRGLPVYQREPVVTDISGSIDELFEGLSQYLKRLHQELLRAEARLQRARAMPRRSPGEHDPLDALSSEMKPLPEAMDVSAADFVDPNDLGSADLDEGGVPAANPRAALPQQIQVRLVLGPMNGRLLQITEPVSAEIRVRMSAANEVELVPADDSTTTGTHVYRRVFDRVFRWYGTSRGV